MKEIRVSDWAANDDLPGAIRYYRSMSNTFPDNDVIGKAATLWRTESGVWAWEVFKIKENGSSGWTATGRADTEEQGRALVDVLLAALNP